MRGSITKKGKKWYIQIDLGYDESGKRKRKTYSGYDTKKAAEADLPKRLMEVQGGTVTSSKDTVASLLETWLEDKAKTVRFNTLNNYKGIVERHLLPGLGKIQLSKLTPAQVQTFYNRLWNVGDGMSASGVQSVHIVLHNALSRALKWGMVSRNVTEAVELPRLPRRAGTVWNAEQAAQFLESARETEPRFWIGFHLAIMTGMRRAEIAGLKWSNIDFEQGFAYIQSIRTTVNGKAVEQEETKTKQSRRAVALSQATLEALREVQRMQEDEKHIFGTSYQDSGYLLRRVNGEPYNPHSFNQAFYRALKASGLPVIRLHDLRHTHATLLLQQGVHPKIVSERLGHANISLTLDTYSHVLPGMQQEAAATFEKLLSSQPKSQ